MAGHHDAARHALQPRARRKRRVRHAPLTRPPLLLLLPLLLLVPGAAPWPLRAPLDAKTALHQPDYSIYKRKADILKEAVGLVAANPATMRSTVERAADGDYAVEVMVVEVDPGGLSTSRSDKVRLLLDFGEHGREYISSEVGLAFLGALANSSALDAAAGGARRAARLRRILEACAFKILPMENTKGRDMVEGGQLCERKNGRGVDPNRNWGVDWGKKEKDYDPNEENPGKAPHSEPEVQIIMREAKAFQPHVWLNVHSGMYALFTPYDHKAQVPEGPGTEASLRMLRRINELSCGGRCVVGSGGKSVGYLAHGTATDYMYEVLKVPLAFTWEIYGDPGAPFEDCFRMFNPLTRVAFEDTVDSWVSALLQLVELLPSHPATAPLLRGAADAARQDEAPEGAAQEFVRGVRRRAGAPEGAPAAAAAAPAAPPEGAPPPPQPGEGGGGPARDGDKPAGLLPWRRQMAGEGPAGGAGAARLAILHGAVPLVAAASALVLVVIWGLVERGALDRRRSSRSD
ncbi:MAG: hypothetical protein J3K34DRAFT_485836 [Monoraphidium minutum]|nr:MAG: hypothetical protein J3K34DRAFT_485836 [Monoraphidium minutum]